MYFLLFLYYRISGEGEETFFEFLEQVLANPNSKKSDLKIEGEVKIKSLEFYDETSDTIFDFFLNEVRSNKKSLIYVTHNEKYAKKADIRYAISKRNIIKI